MLRTVRATRYVTPLREGGSLPAIVEADDLGLYVLKFRGAGQGPLALVAELIAGEIGRALGLRVPELVLVEVDRGARTQRAGLRDPRPAPRQRGAEPRARLPAGLRHLRRRRRPSRVDADLASAAVWFDAFVTNVDRTARNPNLLWWHKTLYFIDHGAALYFHHNWPDLDRMAASRFPAIRDHVLLPWAERTRGGRPPAAPAARARPCSRRSSSRSRRAGWRRIPGFDPAGRRAGYVEVPDAAARGGALVRRGGGACPRSARLTTRSSGWCRASSAGNSSTPG